jgi:hypothetical protein
MPKRGVNMHENEVARAYKTVNDQYIEPVSFKLKVSDIAVTTGYQ